MTIHLLDCPDCRTEFRIRELNNPVPLHCPRCGEAMDVAQARLRPPREKKKTPAPPTPVRSENDTARAKPRNAPIKQTAQVKRGLQMGPLTAIAVVLCAGGAVTASMYFGIRLALRPAGAVVAGNFQARQGTIPESPGSRIAEDLNNRARQQMEAMQQSIRNSTAIQTAPDIVTPAPVPPVSPAAMPDNSQPPEIPGLRNSGVPRMPGRGASMLENRMNQMREKMQADLERARSNAGGPPSFGGPPGARFGAPPQFGPPPGFGIPGQPGAPDPQGNGIDATAPSAPAGAPEDRIRSILQDIKSSNGDLAAIGPLSQLMLRPAIPALRGEVLETLKPLQMSQHPPLTAMAAEVFAQWAGAEQIAELRRLATSTDPLYFATRRKALKAIIGLQTTSVDPAVLSSLEDFLFSYDIQQALTTLGPAAEQPVLQAWPQVTSGAGRRVLIEVLGEIGTAQSLQLLESLATSTDREVRTPAALATEKIRGRR
jgi:hypothetical protein